MVLLLAAAYLIIGIAFAEFSDWATTNALHLMWRRLATFRTLSGFSQRCLRTVSAPPAILGYPTRYKLTRSDGRKKGDKSVMNLIDRKQRALVTDAAAKSRRFVLLGALVWLAQIRAVAQDMKRLTRQSLVAAAMVLSVSGVALADNDCTLKTL